MKRIVIIGASGHAKVVADAATLSGHYDVVGLIAPAGSTGFAKLTVVGDDAALPTLIESLKLDGLIVAIGDNHARSRVAEALRRKVPTLAHVIVIHPKAIVAADVELGEGTFIAAGAIVAPGSRIGRHAIFNTGAQIDHDCRLGDFASVAPGAILGGGVTIGDGAAVGIGATVRHGITIGGDTVIGAGAVVVTNIAPLAVAYGVPARVIRSRRPGDRYL